MADRKDPVGVQQFKVEVNGILICGFSEISGLDMEIETEQIYEGGANSKVYNLFKKMKYGKLVMQKGILFSSYMLDWFNTCKSGKIEKRDIAVSLYDFNGEKARHWEFLGAYPVKCSGPKLAAQNANQIALETVELVYEEQKCMKR